jgi:hypothetical protein
MTFTRDKGQYSYRCILMSIYTVSQLFNLKMLLSCLQPKKNRTQTECRIEAQRHKETP